MRDYTNYQCRFDQSLWVVGPMTQKPHDWHYLLDRDQSYDNSVPRAVICGIASLVVLTANNQRKKALFINDSDTAIYLTKGIPAALNRGIRLNALGGSWEETPDILGYLWVGPFSAISSAANKNLCVIEDI
jgi:hypothetical protein